MPVATRKNLKGLDLRSSDLTRNNLSATDVKNVELNNKHELIKRFGQDDTGAVLPASVKDTLKYTPTGDKLLVTPTLLRRWDGASLINVNLGGNLPANGWGGRVDSAEYNKVLYFTDTELKTDLFKFDGYMAYRAGLPKLSATTSTGAGTYHYRLAYYFVDAWGNKTWGDYVEFNNLLDGATFTGIATNPVDVDGVPGFYRKYGDPQSGPLNAGTLTIDFEPGTGTNYVAGDVMRLQNSSGDYVNVRVDSVDQVGKTITFNAADVSTHTFNVQASTSFETRLVVMLFKSLNATYGYYQNDRRDLNSAGMQAATTGIVAVGGTPGVGTPFQMTPMEDVYDTTVLKGLPPKCKYATIFNNILVLANTVPIDVDTANLFPSAAPDSIFWSDTGVGSTVETFPPFYKDTVGNSGEGTITGLFSYQDGVTVFKGSQIYYLNGNLVLRSYRIRSALTNGIGCASFKSIVEYGGGCGFMSDRGYHLSANQGQPIELSDPIETLWTDALLGDLSESRAALDFKKEHLYIYVDSTPKKVLLYDYYHKEWFIYEGIDASKGLLVESDDLYHSDGTDLFKRSGSYADDGVAIDAYWKGHWENFDAPSIRKKFVNFILSSLGSINWVATLKTQLNWITGVDDTDTTIAITSTIKNQDKKLNASQVKALRVEIGNNILNEGMLVSGFELEYEFTQRKAKGEG